MWSISSLFLICCIATVTVADDPIVTIRNGKIKGRTITSARKEKRVFYSFQEVPFGKAPVGNLRFKDPLPAEKWSGVHDATKDTKVCYQQGTFHSTDLVESEDCLSLNVYTPRPPSANNSLAVLVWFYGGGFLGGHDSFNFYAPHYFMDFDIIVVSVNYRTGPFGFISTGDTVLPGNYGLKDQTLALKWIQDNIKYFGGDPKKVTIFGGSAGGASVAFQLQSKMAHGLYRAAISLSGSSLIGWSYQRDHKQIAFDLAKKVNKSVSTSADVLRILQHAPASVLKLTADNLAASYSGGSDFDPWMNGFAWTPAIEPAHSNAFVTQLQYEAIANGEMARVPLMLGVTSEEMLSRAEGNPSLDTRAKQLDEDPTAMVSKNMHLKTIAQQTTAGKAIQAIYGSFKAHPYKVIKFYTDTVFARPLITHAKLQAKYSDVYFFQFAYHGKMGGNKNHVPGCEWVQHGEDGAYIWAYGGWDGGYDSLPEADRTTSERFRTLLTNFVKYLNPTPTKTALLQNIEWPKVTTSSFRYLNINTSLAIQSDLKKEVYDKWIHVYNTYGVKPYDSF